jgi:hypothetical protein
MRFKYLEPMYGFDKDHDHIRVPRVLEDIISNGISPASNTDHLPLNTRWPRC